MPEPLAPTTPVLVLDRGRPFALLLVLVSSGAGLPCCKKKAPPSSAPAASASAPALGDPEPVCAAVDPGATFLIGEAGPEPPAGEAPVALPFAAELGQAVAYERGFAVSALHEQGQGTVATVALLDQEGKSGRLVDLGEPHGDVDAPRIVAFGSALLVVMPDSDAGSRRLRLARIRDFGSKTELSWGAELSQRRGESQVVDLAGADGRALVVWDEWDDRGGRGVIRVADLGIDDLSRVSEARNVSPESADVEAPQIVSRPGGYWLAWISHSAHAVEASPKKPGPVRRREPPPSVDELDSLVELGQRWLEVLPLAADGSVAGPPRVLTPREAHVLTFDLARGPDGSAWLAWRDDRTSPGVERGQVRAARVALDGSVTHRVLEAEQAAAGAPTLLVDSSASGGGPRAWLSLTAVTDRAHMAALSGPIELGSAIVDDVLLPGVEPLVVRGGRMLTVRPRGKALEFSVLRCGLERRAPRADVQIDPG